MLRILFFSLLFAMSWAVGYSQEICDNGIDDDQDGLIDLNDVIDCNCNGIINETSVIPNGSFEDHSCCPSGISQLVCADTWIQASEPTSDYWHTCGATSPTTVPPPPTPLPDGDGYVGFLNGTGSSSETDYKEYVGSCLTSPLLAGTSYTFNFYMATGNNNTYPIDLHIYGTNNCGNLPFGPPLLTAGCPTNYAGWVDLGFTPVAPNNIAWNTYSVTFTPAQDIYAIAIGPNCIPTGFGQDVSWYYYYLDGLHLSATEADTVTITTEELGDWCTNDLQLIAHSDSIDGTYQWYLDGVALVGETDTILNVSSGGYPSGTYTFRQTIGTECETIDHVISVGSLVADFTFNNACFYESIPFTDNSTIAGGTITNWDWDFGDGNTSSIQHPSHTYTNAGTYMVTLTITGSGGCSTSLQQSITAYPQPQVAFTFADACINTGVAFTDQSTITAPDNLNSWTWNFGDGNTSSQQQPSHTYGINGTFDVQLLVISNNGCIDSLVQPIAIHPQPVAIFTATDDCIVATTSFTDLSTTSSGTINNWQWDFGDGNTSSLQHPNHLYTNDGTYNVTLIVSNDLGCSDTTTQVLNRFLIPTANFTVADECVYDVLSFTDNSTGNISTWEWDFGDGNTSNQQSPNHQYATAGNYNVQLIVTTVNNCADTLEQTVEAYPAPSAQFTNTLGNPCFIDSVNFIDISTIDAPGQINAWTWDFGNGNTTNMQHPTHHYTTSGTFDVTLIVSSNQGCTDTIIQQINSFPAPIASFTVNADCWYNALVFNDNSSVVNGTITNWEWDFGDGNTSNQQSPNHQYATAGSYTVQLVVTSNNGCSDTIQQSVETYPQPNVSFIANDTCVFQQVGFTDLSTIPTPYSISNWWWDFGDGNASFQPNPVHSYGADGTYQVELLVASNQGCVDSITIPITIHPQPQTAFSVMDDCLYNAAVFTDQSTMSTGSIVNWEWDFGDGNQSNQPSPTHPYSNANTYNVQLITTSNYGCSDTLVQSTTRHPIPVANFSANNVCLYDEVQFNDNSSVNGPDFINTWVWNFDDGSPLATSQNEVHQYAVEGSYDVQLIISSNNGCTSDTSLTVTVYPVPNANFLASDVCINASPNSFTDLSTISTGSINSWLWDFGDGGSSMLQNPSYDYATAGQYNTTLVVTSDMGCSDTVVSAVNVWAKPNANFTATTRFGCSPICVDFIDNTFSSSAIVSWEWDFGNGNFSDETDPTACYENLSNTNEALFDIQLIVVNDNGCYDTIVAEDHIAVWPNPKADFYAEPPITNVLDPAIQFVNTSIGGDTYDWNFGDGEFDTVFEPLHLYSDSGLYTITLITTNQYGCTHAHSDIVKIEPVITAYIPNAFTPDGDGINDLFFIHGYGIVEEDFHFMIFDRWGELVYSTSSFIPWDGTNRGTSAQIDVYVYKVQYKDVFGQLHEQTGHVSLLR